MATGLRPDPEPLAHDDDEDITAMERLTHDEVLAAVAAGRIEDAKTLVALTLYERHRARWESGR